MCRSCCLVAVSVSFLRACRLREGGLLYCCRLSLSSCFHLFCNACLELLVVFTPLFSAEAHLGEFCEVVLVAWGALKSSWEYDQAVWNGADIALRMEEEVACCTLF